MKILRLTAENVKRIKLVEITPRGDVIQLTGANASGKSSVLDAIMYALGGMDTVPGAPIRRGANSARIRLDLGDLVVHRTFGARGSELRVEAADGRKLTRPQELLDALIGRLAFDPLEFSRMKPREQFRALTELVNLPIDLDAMAVEDGDDALKRTEINREIKTAKFNLSEAPAIPPDTPPRPLEAAIIRAELARANAHNAERDAAIRDNQRVEDMIAQQVERVREAEERLKAAQGVLADLRMRPMKPMSDEIDTEAIMDKLERVQEVNRMVEERERQEKRRAALEKLEADARAFTARIDARAAERRRTLEAASFPVPGLSLGDGMVLLDGIPLEQASGAEKLRVSVAVAMAGNPKLRVLRIADGSLLDSASLAAIAAMATENDYQIWIEQVDESGKVGVVLSDGTVIADNQEGGA